MVTWAIIPLTTYGKLAFKSKVTVSICIFGSIQGLNVYSSNLVSNHVLNDYCGHLFPFNDFATINDWNYWLCFFCQASSISTGLFHLWKWLFLRIAKGSSTYLGLSSFYRKWCQFLVFPKRQDSLLEGSTEEWKVRFNLYYPWIGLEFSRIRYGRPWRIRVSSIWSLPERSK